MKETLVKWMTGVQVEGSSTLPDPEALVMKSLAKEEELMDEVGSGMEAEF